MILKVKAVSLNTPETFHSSLQMFTLYLRKKGAVSWWDQTLHLRPILLNSFRKTTEMLHSVKQLHNKTSAFSHGKWNVTRYE